MKFVSCGPLYLLCVVLRVLGCVGGGYGTWNIQELALEEGGAENLGFGLC